MEKPGRRRVDQTSSKCAKKRHLALARIEDDAGLHALAADR